MLRSEATEWNTPWSTGDRDRIAAALEAIPDGKCVLASAGNRIGVWVNGRLALEIYPNYLAWKGEVWTKDLPPALFADMHENGRDWWYELSTFQPSG